MRAFVTKKDGREYGLRGGAKHAAKMKLCVEGEYVNTLQIAERIGVHEETARKRLAVLRKKDGPITWAALSETQR